MELFRACLPHQIINSVSTGPKYIPFTPLSSNKWMIISLLGISIVFFSPYLPATQYLYHIYQVFVFVQLPGYSYLVLLKKKKKNELLKELSLCLLNLYIHLRSSKGLYGADTDIHDGTTELFLVSHQRWLYSVLIKYIQEHDLFLPFYNSDVS